MIRKINYITESAKHSFKHGLENFLTENLYYTTVEKFIKQMKLYIPDFKDYIAGIEGNRIKVVFALCKIIDKKDFLKLVKTFNYRIANTTGFFIELVPEKDEQTRLTNYYLHLSPIRHLDKIGIKCKSSGRFEQYEPRIFLYPLKLNDSIDVSDIDKIFKLIYPKCESIVNKFNEIYHESETYSAYIIDLPKNYPIYKDPSNEDEAIYVENNIPAKYVNFIGFIESEESKKGFYF